MKTEKENCPFCKIPAAQIVAENELCLAFYDQYPVNEGHTLIVPKRHVADYFELSSAERSAMEDLLLEVKGLLESRFHPDGFNIGVNVGEAAGQTIFHVHLHLIPRYDGDVDDPKGGVRGVIPGRQKY